VQTKLSLVLVGLAACALASVSSAVAAPKAAVVAPGAPCTEVKGEGHTGPVALLTQRFQMRMDLTVGASGPQVLIWRETKPGGGLRVVGYRFEARSVTCETREDGFTLRASGSAHFRLGPKDIRAGSEEVLVEEHAGATDVTIATAIHEGASALLELPAGRFGAAVSIPGVQGQLNRNSLHAL
jgi:hypothetical protein